MCMHCENVKFNMAECCHSNLLCRSKNVLLYPHFSAVMETHSWGCISNFLFFPFFFLSFRISLKLAAGEVLEGVFVAPQNKEESRKNVEQVLQFISSRHIRMPHISPRGKTLGGLCFSRCHLWKRVMQTF